MIRGPVVLDARSKGRLPMGPRAFDPVALGHAEAGAWVAYYRREWWGLLRGAVAMVRVGFGMSWPRSVYGAVLTAVAIRQWAPYPDNNAHGARLMMRRFYALVVRDGEVSIDPAKAARLELEWWRVHRVHQRETGVDEADLVAALTELYAYTYSATPEAVTEAARHRTVAMRYSDAWHAAGCRRDDARLGDIRAELVACYSALLAAVQPR